MKLLWYGNTTLDCTWLENEKIWGVKEQNPCGFLRLYYLFKGELIYTDKKQTTTLTPNNIYLFPANAPYQITNTSGNIFQCTWFHIRIPYTTLHKLSIISPTTQPIYFKIMDVLQMLLENVLNENHLLDNNNLDNNNLANNKEDLLLQGINLFLSQCLVDGFLHTHADGIYPLVEKLREQACNNLSITTFAKNCGYSKEHFTRLFTKQLKISPYQFVVNERMSIARQYLREGKKIKEVSNLIGYSDSKNFQRIFKTKYGITPSEYQKNVNQYI